MFGGQMKSFQRQFPISNNRLRRLLFTFNFAIKRWFWKFFGVKIIYSVYLVWFRFNFEAWFCTPLFFFFFGRESSSASYLFELIGNCPDEFSVPFPRIIWCEIILISAVLIFRVQYQDSDSDKGYRKQNCHNIRFFSFTSSRYFINYSLWTFLCLLTRYYIDFSPWKNVVASFSVYSFRGPRNAWKQNMVDIFWGWGGGTKMTPCLTLVSSNGKNVVASISA